MVIGYDRSMVMLMVHGGDHGSGFMLMDMGVICVQLRAIFGDEDGGKWRFSADMGVNIILYNRNEFIFDINEL